MGRSARSLFNASFWMLLSVSILFSGCSSTTTPSAPAMASPTISAQPQNVNAYAGDTATFNVSAAGNPSPSYQWLKGGAPIAGATGATYSTATLTASDSGSAYSVTVTNSVGSITSTTAALTVSLKAAITTNPVDVTVNDGSSATFSVVTTGTAPLTYQWMRGGGAISGATNASYTLAGATIADSGALFSVKVSNGGATVTSTSAKLTVNAVAPTVATNPADVTISDGGTAMYSVVAAGTAPLTYQWMRAGTPVTGATGSSYTLTAATLSDSGAVFSVKVTNTAGSATSSTAKLTVNALAPSIITNPGAVTVSDGASASFSVVAAGSAPLTYQWMRNGTAISGATSAGYTFTPAFADSGATFSVKVTNSAGSVTSNNALLTVNASAPSITTQPAGATYFVGETGTFSVAAKGTAPTYQWRKNSAAITGATSASYTTPAFVAADDNAKFDVIVSNSAGSVTSSAATLRVGPFATSYTTQKGAILNLHAWPGAKVAVLSKSATLDPGVMRNMLNAADGSYNYYAGAVGKLPSLFFNYNGLATIAETGVGGVDLCGAGCTYIGATGMEIADDYFNILYNGIATSNVYDQVIFYEFGRSFWLFGSQLEYKSPASSSCEVTGFAVLMRYRSIMAQGLTGTFGGSVANYNNQYNNSLGMIDTYAANSSLNFNNTFLVDSFSSPYGGCADLWSSMVIRLARDYGGETFIQNVFKESLKRPAAATTQDAIDNFVLASSAAAGKNLTLTFGTTWKWPISTSASQEARSKYGNPQ